MKDATQGMLRDLRIMIVNELEKMKKEDYEFKKEIIVLFIEDYVTQLEMIKELILKLESEMQE